jgi:SulP family sulfate permease
MHRMSEMVAMRANLSMAEEEEDIADSEPARGAAQREQLPAGVEAYQVSGPLFFAVANRLNEVLNQFPKPPRVFILRMRLVPLIDVSGVAAVRQVLRRCSSSGTRVILSGLREQPRSILLKMGIVPDNTQLCFAGNFSEAVEIVRRISPRLR